MYESHWHVCSKRCVYRIVGGLGCTRYYICTFDISTGYDACEYQTCPIRMEIDEEVATLCSFNQEGVV